MSLSINDMVWARKDAEMPWTLCRVQKLSGGAGQDSADIFFRHHTAAKIDSKETLIRTRSLAEGKFHVRKVQVDSLGRIRSAHD